MQTFSITDFSGDTRYGHAVARVRVLESQLLPRRAFVRMAEAPKWEAMLEELRGSLYAEPGPWIWTLPSDGEQSCDR